MKPRAIALAAIFTGPITWFLSFESGFALAPTLCGGSGRMPLYLETSACVAIVAVAAILCSSVLRKTHPAAPQQPVQVQPGRIQDLDRALALGGIAVNLFSLLVIVAQTLPTLVMSGCE